MAAPDQDPAGFLVVVYRAVGKLAYGHSGPTHSTDFVDLDDAMAIGAAHVEAGVWTEFYIKNVHRRRAVTRH